MEKNPSVLHLVHFKKVSAKQLNCDFFTTDGSRGNYCIIASHEDKIVAAGPLLATKSQFFSRSVGENSSGNVKNVQSRVTLEVCVLRFAIIF